MRRIQKRFPVGTPVTTTMGISRDGTVCKPFYWRESTDGTYKQPDKEEVPIQWSDGTKGYAYKLHITPLSEVEKHLLPGDAARAIQRHKARR